MQKLILILLLGRISSLWALELKVGDILLQPLHCSSCTLIEEQEGTIYSHMGMIIQIEPEVLVVESLGTVRSLSFEVFRARNQKEQNLGVYRLKDEKAVTSLSENQKQFSDFFFERFSGLTYDKEFLWDNLDEKGLEKLYCSEMITKLLNGFLQISIPTKIMKFDKNRDYWIRYFNGNPPDNKPGNSPGDFERSDLFHKVGEL